MGQHVGPDDGFVASLGCMLFAQHRCGIVGYMFGRADDPPMRR